MSNSSQSQILDEICCFIGQTARLQEKLHQEWSENPEYQRINFRRKNLSELHKKEYFQDYLVQYRDFAEISLLEIEEDLFPTSLIRQTDWRVKEWDSIRKRKRSVLSQAVRLFLKMEQELTEISLQD